MYLLLQNVVNKIRTIFFGFTNYTQNMFYMLSNLCLCTHTHQSIASLYLTSSLEARKIIVSFCVLYENIIYIVNTFNAYSVNT